jgi:hypothetical protein
MARTRKLPDPNEDNRNKEKRFSQEGWSPNLNEPIAGGHKYPDSGHKNLDKFPEVDIEVSEVDIEGPETFALTLRVSGSFLEAVKALAIHEDISRGHVLRKALGLYSIAQAKSKRGLKLGFIEFTEDGEPEIKEVIDL